MQLIPFSPVVLIVPLFLLLGATIHTENGLRMVAKRRTKFSYDAIKSIEKTEILLPLLVTAPSSARKIEKPVLLSKSDLQISLEVAPFEGKRESKCPLHL